ncbi:MAG: DUF4328 domain-containing protein, partial [Phycisphaerales bacterium]|nr:DUF4328 domain-containing protein [Phycisphaerales bacterium]
SHARRPPMHENYRPPETIVFFLTFLFAGLMLGGGINVAGLIMGFTATSEADQSLGAFLTDLSGLVWLLVFPTGILFLMWHHRTSRNAHALGAQGLSFSPLGCVLWWFCPLLNLFKPFSSIMELWRASDPTSVVDPYAWRLAPVPALIPVWWSFWIFMGMVGQTTAEGWDPFGITERMAFFLALCTSLSLIPASLCAMLVVRGIHRRQLLRAHHLSKALHLPGQHPARAA